MSRHFTATQPVSAAATTPPNAPTSRLPLRKPANLPRLAVDVGEAAEMLGVSRDFFDLHIRHELRWVRVGRLKLVPVAELERWLDRSASMALDAA